MASGPITSRQIEGGKVKAVTDFIFLSSKITEDNNCSHEIKIRLFLGRTAMTNLDSTLKSRDITFQQRSLRSIKGPYVQSKVLMVFPVVMYRCESWTIKKAENWRIDAFDLWYWRRLLRVPWTARRANQSILKDVNPEYSLEGLMLNLLYFGHLMWRANSLEKTLIWESLRGGGKESGMDVMVS